MGKPHPCATSRRSTPRMAPVQQRCMVYLARGVERGQPDHEPTELIHVTPLPIAEALRMAHAGEITDSLSALALLLCEPYLAGNVRIDAMARERAATGLPTQAAEPVGACAGRPRWQSLMRRIVWGLKPRMNGVASTLRHETRCSVLHGRAVHRMPRNGARRIASLIGKRAASHAADERIDDLVQREPAIEARQPLVPRPLTPPRRAPRVRPPATAPCPTRHRRPARFQKSQSRR